MANPNSTMDSNPNKKRRMLTKNDDHKSPSPQLRWRSQNDQRLYSTKLVQALRNTTAASSSSSTSAFTVKEAADRALATVAKGTTRWSRAILKTRLRIMSKRVVRKNKRVTGNGGVWWRRSSRRVAVVEKKVKTLGRLVPGCRKAALPSLLEETSDYIAALEMQMRTMTALAELLSGGGSIIPAASSLRLNSDS